MNGPFDKVVHGFNQDLFLRLAPPLTKMHLKRFDGCLTGHEVHVELTVLGKKENWVSVITEHKQTNYEFSFLDEGKVLPAPLKKWKHLHRITKSGNKTFITDLIEFSTDNPLLDFVLYPVLAASFLWRKPIYRKVFRG